MKYALVGYGRMGRAIDATASERGHQRVAVLGRDWLRRPDDSLAGAEVAFEFSRPTVAESNVVGLLRAGVNVVCGTTGWDQGPALNDALKISNAALIVAPNFSPGTNLFFRLVRQAAQQLSRSAGFEPFIVEHHHRGKRDMPSGTAHRLADLVCEADPRLEVVYGGQANAPLSPQALHVTSIRAGAEPGTHQVGFDGPDELVRIEHAARGRSGFARGAVLAGEWLQGRSGVHHFDAVLDEWLASHRV